jgi:hypothetical protein
VDVVVGLLAWLALLGGAIALRARFSRFGVAVLLLAVTVLLTAALVGLTLTRSAMFGWLAFGSLLAVMVGRFALMGRDGTAEETDRDPDADRRPRWSRADADG